MVRELAYGFRGLGWVFCNNESSLAGSNASPVPIATAIHPEEACEEKTGTQFRSNVAYASYEAVMPTVDTIPCALH